MQGGRPYSCWAGVSDNEMGRVGPFYTTLGPTLGPALWSGIGEMQALLYIGRLPIRN